MDLQKPPLGRLFAVLQPRFLHQPTIISSPPKSRSLGIPCGRYPASRNSVEVDIMRKLTIAGLVGCAVLGCAGGALAKNNDNSTDEAAIMANAKVTMTQAIATAEQVTGGKAVGTGIEDQDGTVFLEVQIVKGGQRQKVLVDPQSGQVAKAVTEDNEESEDGDD
jgi:hypothetical protein